MRAINHILREYWFSPSYYHTYMGQIDVYIVNIEKDPIELLI